MANEISIYEPRCLAEVVRTTPPVRTFFLDNYFTNIKTFATKSVDIDVVKGDRRMASFVHPLAGGQVLKNEGYQTESFTPPLINPMTVTTANDAMERMPGEDLYSGMTPEERAAKQLIEDYQRLNDAATRREEWMAVRTIMDGQIPVVGPGVNKVIDFGFTNKVKLDGTKKWGASAAKPLDNLEDWVDQVLETALPMWITLLWARLPCATSWLTPTCRICWTTAASNWALSTPRTCPMARATSAT